MQFGNSVIKLHEFADKESIIKLLKLVEDQVTMQDGSTTKIKIVLTKRINMWRIHGKNKNKNMYIKNELMWKKELDE